MLSDFTDLERPTQTPGTRAQERRGRGPVLPGLLVSALVVSAVVVSSPEGRLRELFGAERQGNGSYAFKRVQPDTGEPVGYNTCQSIHVVVNPQGAPDNWSELVDTAIRHINGPSGLRLTYVGTTTDRNFERRGYSVIGQMPPVIVGWATEQEAPALAGDTAGIGGSSAVAIGATKTRFITGRILLDVESEAFDDAEDPEMAQAILDHEFGHVVGLGHVDDPGELMHEDNIGRTSWGPGDLKGLAKLGAIPC